MKTTILCQQITSVILVLHFAYHAGHFLKEFIVLETSETPEEIQLYEEPKGYSSVKQGSIKRSVMCYRWRVSHCLDRGVEKREGKRRRERRGEREEVGEREESERQEERREKRQRGEGIQERRGKRREKERREDTEERKGERVGEETGEKKRKTEMRERREDMGDKRKEERRHTGER